MHAAEREKLILDMVRKRGFVSFKELDRKLDASPATLRRDLDRLESIGAISRVRGGAKAAEESLSNHTELRGAPFHENITRHKGAKQAIGEAAAALCKQGEAIIIDGGSTTLQMCEHLAPLNLQVLTNSLHIVSALLPQPRTRISIPAGTVFREQNIVLDPYEGEGAARYRGSKMFLGAAAVGRHGLMQLDSLLLQAERRLIECADQLVVMVDSSKFDGPAGHVVCPLTDIDILITDGGIGREHRQMLDQAGVQTIIVDAPRN
ncbi:MAG: DeoR/GlpR family DNA-binding transcription regulator [Terricaulis sp.]